jgi:hypothetical protein
MDKLPSIFVEITKIIQIRLTYRLSRLIKHSAEQAYSSNYVPIAKDWFWDGCAINQ